jgi:hypothetical protein
MFYPPDPIAEIQSQCALPFLREIDRRFIIINLELDEAINATVESVHEIQAIVSHRFLQNLWAHAQAS